MSIRVTERSFYPIIIDLFREIARRYGVEIRGIQEVRIPDRRAPPKIQKLIQVHEKLLEISKTVDRVLTDIKEVLQG